MAVRRGEMLRRLPAVVRVSNQNERLEFKLVFANHTGREFRKLTESCTLGQILVALIESWDAEYPVSIEGFEELEDEHPGICDALLTAYHKTRAVALEGN